MIRTVALATILVLLLLGGIGAVPAPPEPPKIPTRALSSELQAAVAGAPVAARPDDRDELFGFAAPTLTPREDGALVARGEHYTATFERDRFSMKKGAQGFGFVLEDVTAGGRSLLSPAEGPAASDLHVEYRRGKVVEEYDVVDRGVEQSFRILEGSGEIVVRGRLETSLRARPHPDGGFMGLKLSDGVRDVIQFGRATIVDARGRRISADLELSRDAYEIRVPAPYTDAAAFPIVIDPLIGPVITVEAGAGEPGSLYLRGRDISYNASGDQYLVVWSKITQTAPTVEADVYGQRYQSDGTAVGGTITIDTVAGSQGNGLAAAVRPVSNMWYVVWGDNRDAATLGFEIYGNVISSAGTVQYPVAFKVSDSVGLLEDFAPDIVYEGPNLLIAWQTLDTTPDNTVQMRRINSGTPPAVPPAGVGAGTPVALDPVMRDFRPALAFLTGYGTLCSWTKADPGVTTMEVYAKLIPIGGAPPAASILLTTAPSATATWSDVCADTANSQYYVAWALDQGGAGVNVVGRLVSGAGAALGAGPTLVRDAVETCSIPRCTFVPLREQVFVSYERSTNIFDIEATRLGSCDLAILEPAIVLAATPDGDRDPGQSATTAGTQTLTVWLQGGATYVGTYGQRFDVPNDSVCTLGPLTITTPCPMAPGNVGTVYAQTVTGSGGAPPYTWSLSAGGLPPGLAIDAVTGLISGTPTTVGTFGFTLQLVDTTPTTTTLVCSITISAVGGGGGVGTRKGGGARGWLPSCSASVADDAGSVLPATLLALALAALVRLLLRR